MEPVYYIYALLSRPDQPDSQKFILEKTITFEIYDSSQGTGGDTFCEAKKL